MRGTSVRWRRRRDAVLLLVGAVAVGLVGLLGAVLGEPGERIARMWIGAEMGDDGTARITEVIDYDFDGEQRHGIYRDVPGTEAGDVRDVAVTADGEPVPHRVEGGLDARIVIGDPDATVTGVHRYRIEYTLPRRGDEEWLAWDAVGTRWDVPIGDVDAHLAAPFALEDPSCVAGASGSREGCAGVRQPVPGQLDVAVEGLDAHEGLTLAARVGDEDGGGAALPEAPGGRAPAAEAGGGATTGWLWATAIALVAAALAAELVRWAGRERVQEAKGRVRRVDIRRLGASVTPRGEPPAGLAPAHAGILLTDRVRQEHLAAWLLTAAAKGHLTISGDRRPVLHQASGPPAGGAGDPLTAEVLGAVFARKPRVPLGQYNRAFATAWKLLGRRLDEWRRAGGEGLWEPRGRRRRFARWVGAVAAVAGVAAVGIAATDVAVVGAAWRAPLAVGAALAGAGLAVLVRAWELPSLTARGSDLWCQAEGYRRHLAGRAERGGEAHDDAGIVTAWAVALGEAETWTAAADAARTRTGTGTGASIPGDDTVRPHLALYLPLAAASAATAPSSGGSGSSSDASSGYGSGGDSGGGGGGGEVGGGDGGGGGGSW
ncbi:DUF2207 domain-containing protein [Streptomyces sp. PT12]|uniref:DUF2207 domain-containing protein n=1 Tax=Streptomyces sp. PT12 TaxID=1510197 RepID=UPI0015EFAD19|nr:DUF2207 domain-containing protein [Streptomyces sp. PT12]